MGYTAQLLILIPAYNEADHLAEVIRGARQFLPVAVVNDGSTDSTAQIVQASGARLINQIPNQGKGTALRKGFEYALKAGYDAVVTLDADGQHAPEDISAFLEAFEQYHADLIIGSRNFSRMPFIRRISNTLGRWSFSWAIGQPIQDNQSGFRLVSRRLMAAVLDSQEDSFEFEVEMIVTCLKNGFKLAWVPIQTIYAGEKSHIRPARHLYHFIRMLIKTRRESMVWRRE